MLKEQARNEERCGCGDTKRPTNYPLMSESKKKKTKLLCLESVSCLLVAGLHSNVKGMELNVKGTISISEWSCNP